VVPNAAVIEQLRDEPKINSLAKDQKRLPHGNLKAGNNNFDENNPKEFVRTANLVSASLH
jgi:hypothetical protein